MNTLKDKRFVDILDCSDGILSLLHMNTFSNEIIL